MKRRTNIFISSVLTLLSMIFIIVISTVDVAGIGPKGTKIGLSHINKAVFDFFGVNIIWYDITDFLGFAAIFVAFVFAVTGLTQLIKRKSFMKVDKNVLILGALYIVVIGLYLLFETEIINYRPIVMPGGENPEASFPSSHTMLVCVILGSAIMLLDDYVKNKTLCCILKILCIVIIGITIIGRLISGVHWFTDIIGACLISATLLASFNLLRSR